MGNTPVPSGTGPSGDASPDGARSGAFLPAGERGGERTGDSLSGVVPPADGRPILMAAIIGAHGIGGEVRLKLFAEGPEALRVYRHFDADGRSLTLKSVRPGPNGAVARFAELTDRNAAEALRGTGLTVPRSALPPLAEGEYYHVDLIDLPCVSDSGEALGRVVAVENFGAGDILEIERPIVLPAASAKPDAPGTGQGGATDGDGPASDGAEGGRKSSGKRPAGGASRTKPPARRFMVPIHAATIGDGKAVIDGRFVD